MLIPYPSERKQSLCCYGVQSWHYGSPRPSASVTSLSATTRNSPIRYPNLTHELSNFGIAWRGVKFRLLASHLGRYLLFLIMHTWGTYHAIHNWDFRVPVTFQVKRNEKKVSELFPSTPTSQNSDGRKKNAFQVSEFPNMRKEAKLVESPTSDRDLIHNVPRKVNSNTYKLPILGPRNKHYLT